MLVLAYYTYLAPFGIIIIHFYHGTAEGCMDDPGSDTGTSVRTFSCPLTTTLCQKINQTDVLCKYGKESEEHEVLICLWEVGQFNCLAKTGYSYRLTPQTLTVVVNSGLEDGQRLECRLKANGNYSQPCQPDTVQKTSTVDPETTFNHRDTRNETVICQNFCLDSEENNWHKVSTGLYVVSVLVNLVLMISLLYLLCKSRLACSCYNTHPRPQRKEEKPLNEGAVKPLNLCSVLKAIKDYTSCVSQDDQKA